MPIQYKSATQTALWGSFSIANQPVQPRLIVAVEGLEKQGKTNFALTAPGPLIYQSWDIGDEGVIEKFQQDKVIYKAEYGVVITKDDNAETIKAKMDPEWTRCVKDYRIGLDRLRDGSARTIIKDTSTEEWEALRLARLGKVTQVMPHHYGPLNTEYTGLIKELYDTPGNAVFLMKLKDEWLDNVATGKSNRTGKHERAGHKDMGYLVQVNCRAWRDAEGHFHITVLDCRQNPQVAGLDLMDDMATFAWLGIAVYPHTNLADWL